ncbi:MAG TPA: PTS glucose transporter subunit IIA [Clostridia bacterium]|nr:PTS glucose transporter subunit IIA [Clostridia bacterium]
MFSIFKKSFSIFAPANGRVIDLASVPDQVFAQKMAGDGVAIEITGDIIAAPADGVLTLIFKTNHAFGITTDNGVEILTHIGLDTIELEGEGFERIAQEGIHVKAGDPLIKLNRPLIEGKGYSLLTSVLITNVSFVDIIEYRVNTIVEAGKGLVMKYKIK